MKWIQLYNNLNYLALPFFRIEMKTDLFQSSGHCWIFQIHWHNSVSLSQHHFLGFEIVSWNSIPSLALFVIMPPKAHLTSHSRMSGSRWVVTPSWLSRSFRKFCIVLLCILATSWYLLLLLGPCHFSHLLCPSLHEMSPWISNFLEEISSLSHSIVFLYFFAFFIEGGFLISPC